MNKQTEIIVSGFGGQGALFAGQLLAYAGMDEGKHVTWIPSYGPEIRGGTAHCITIISDEEIGSPFVRRPAAAIVLNQPSLEKYGPLVRPGGVLIIGGAFGEEHVSRSDIREIRVPAQEIANALGNTRLANVVCLGALLAATKVLPLEALERALANHLPERHRHLLPANKEALRRGAIFVPDQELAA
ncbi:MAG: 2-oxoacid:acceptor oxidoreductase family protein [Anaerolineae bacterium]|nr:2-oxoacid:acceptor oxidoreductase family protein [Anaerolineae bacterium]